MHKHCPEYQKCGGKTAPKTIAKAQAMNVSLKSYCVERSQAWRAIPFDFFTDSGNVNPGEKKC